MQQRTAPMVALPSQTGEGEDGEAKKYAKAKLGGANKMYYNEEVGVVARQGSRPMPVRVHPL